MEKGMVTVVVPVYKTGKYLDACVQSIVDQTYANLEILLIDDGSPDECPQLCDAWASRDPRIRVIHKENQGLGMARNTGIENARGEFICFYDSDDLVDPRTVELAYTACKRENADIAIYGFVATDEEGNEKRRIVPNPEKQVYVGAEVQELLLPDLIGPDRCGNQTNLIASAWASFYSVEMLQSSGWRFASEREIIAEDVYFMLGLYQHVKKAVILEETLYFYRENNTSLTRSYRPDRFDRIKAFYFACIELCRKNGYSEEVKRRCAEPFLSFSIAALKQETAYYNEREERLLHLRKIIDDSLLQQVLQRKHNDKSGMMRRILFWSINHKCYFLCESLLCARNARK